MAKSPYKGRLRTKIKLPQLPKPLSPALEFWGLKTKKDSEREWKEHCRISYDYLMRQRLAKLPALYEHYDIFPTEPGADKLLILALAESHVPGFQYCFEGKPGRPGTWNDFALLRLFFAVEEILSRKNGASISSACHSLSIREPWKTMIAEKGSTENKAKTLQNQYSKARKTKFIKMYLENKGTGNMHEAFILDLIDALKNKSEKEN